MDNADRNRRLRRAGPDSAVGCAERPGEKTSWNDAGDNCDAHGRTPPYRPPCCVAARPDPLRLKHHRRAESTPWELNATQMIGTPTKMAMTRIQDVCVPRGFRPGHKTPEHHNADDQRSKTSGMVDDDGAGSRRGPNSSPTTTTAEAAAIRYRVRKARCAERFP